MAPIGVFDSGIGGLSVVVELLRLRPGTAVRYVADQAHAPYGERDLETVRARAEAIAESLLDRGATTIVVACHSASGAALDHLRERLDVPVVGMEPAVKPAAAETRSGIVGVLATDATLEAHRFAAVVDRHARDVAVVARSCPGLAAAIERGDGLAVERLGGGYVADLTARGVDTIVLGCTHYGLVADRLARYAGPGVRLVDPAPAVARRTLEVAPTVDDGPLVVTTTGDPRRLRRRLGALAERHPVLADAEIEREVGT